MGKMAKEEKKIIKDFENISKEMVPKPKYFKNILTAVSFAFIVLEEDVELIIKFLYENTSITLTSFKLTPFLTFSIELAL